MKTDVQISDHSPHVVKALRLFFGDFLGAIARAILRNGPEPVGFILEAVGRNTAATADELGSMWKKKFSHPVDHGLIEVVLANMERHALDSALQKRTFKAFKKAGMLPPPRLAA